MKKMKSEALELCSLATERLRVGATAGMGTQEFAAAVHAAPHTELRASKVFDVRFSEVDLMRVVWHGSYMLYFEDARELFGQKYDLSYQGYIDHGYYAPIVEMNFQYKRPIRYGMRPRIDIIYRPAPSAKIVFDYEIRDPEDESLFASGHSVQVFMDLQYQMVWENPPFYLEWKRRWGVDFGM